MNQPSDLGSPPQDTRHLSTGDEWVSPRDYNFHMDVSNRLTAIEITLRAMQDAATSRRGWLTTFFSGVIATAALASLILLIVQVVSNGGG